MDIFCLAEFGKLKYVHHTFDTYSGLQWASALSSENVDSIITHLYHGYNGHTNIS